MRPWEKVAQKFKKSIQQNDKKTFQSPKGRDPARAGLRSTSPHYAQKFWVNPRKDKASRRVVWEGDQFCLVLNS